MSANGAATGGLGTRLYAGLSAYYFHFYATLGLVLPYFPLWMADRGLSASQIGLILAAHGVTRIVLPPLWGHVADRSGKRLPLIQIASFASSVGFAVLPLSNSFVSILAAVLLFSVFWNATMPQFEAYTFGQLERQGGDYSRIRLWGSIGFVVAVLGGGSGFDAIGIGWFPLAAVLTIVAMSASAMSLPRDSAVTAHAESEPLGSVLRRPVVVALFAACMLHQASFGPYYGFFSLYMEQAGWGKSMIGFLWAFGVVAEVIVFVWTGALIRRVGLRAVFLFAMATTVARWAALEHVIHDLSGLLVVQLFHFSSFGLYHAAAVSLVHREFTGQLRGRGQALFVSLGFGVGGSVGSFAAGAMWDWAGPAVVYQAAAGSALIASLIAWRWVR